MASLFDDRNPDPVPNVNPNLGRHARAVLRGLLGAVEFLARDKFTEHVQANPERYGRAPQRREGTLAPSRGGAARVLERGVGVLVPDFVRQAVASAGSLAFGGPGDLEIRGGPGGAMVGALGVVGRAADEAWPFLRKTLGLGRATEIRKGAEMTSADRGKIATRLNKLPHDHRPTRSELAAAGMVRVSDVTNPAFLPDDVVASRRRRVELLAQDQRATGRRVTDVGPEASERVTAAIMRTPDGQVFRGATHGEARNEYLRSLGYDSHRLTVKQEEELRPLTSALEEGFETSAGRQLMGPEGRREASTLAQQQGQMRRAGASPELLHSGQVQYPADPLLEGRKMRQAAARDSETGGVVPAADNVASRLAQQPTLDEQIASAHAEFGGSTFDPRAGSTLAGSDRWAVSTRTQEYQAEPFTREQVAAFRQKHAKELAKPGREVGTWFDKARKRHGKHEINITRTFESRDKAEKFGRGLGEVSILHLDPEFNFPEYDILYRTPQERIAARRRRVGVTQRWEDPEFMSPQRAELREEIARGLEPHELEQLEGDPKLKLWAKVEDAYLRAPDPRSVASLIGAGAGQAQWYDPVADVLWKMLGNDAPRFAAVLAATSPGTAVKPNLQAAAKVWQRWNELGRATTPEAIEELDKAARGLSTYAGKNSKTVRNNLQRVLSMTDDELLDLPTIEQGGVLSGPKVDAFYSNLLGETQRLVLDTHMAGGFGTLAKDVNAPHRNLAMSATLRNAGHVMERETGTRLDPRQIQAAYWSVIKGLRDTSKGRGIENVLQGRGRAAQADLFGPPADLPLPPGAAANLRRTPTFQGLLSDPDVRPLFEGAGLEIPAVPLADPLAVPPSFVRPADITDAAQRNDLAERGRPLFDLAPLLLPAGAVGGSLFYDPWQGRVVGENEKAGTPNGGTGLFGR